MPWVATIFFFVGALLVLQSAWAFIDGLRFLRLVETRRDHPRALYNPSVALLIPCKGVDARFDANLQRFLAQDYPDYQILFVVATAEEIAYQALHRRLDTRSAPGASLNPRTSLLVAGLSGERGEKVNNLLHGIAAVAASTAVYVFADIDAAPAADWLRSLVAPLADPRVTVSTGFRWYLPGEGFVSQLRAAWDTSIATMLGDRRHNFAWGGSMAIRADDFRNLGIATKYWANTISDDFAMTRAVREAGGMIAFAPQCLVASREESNFREFLRWSTRQIIITRVYASHLWKFGLATSVFYCGTVVCALIALAIPGTSAVRRLAVAAVLGVVLLLGTAKGYIRSLVARELFAEEVGDHGACYWRLSPLVPWIMLWNFIVAGLTRRIEWRGTEYDLVSSDKVRVIRRSSG